MCALIALAVASASLRIVLDAVQYFLTVDRGSNLWLVSLSFFIFFYLLFYIKLDGINVWFRTTLPNNLLALWDQSGIGTSSLELPRATPYVLSPLFFLGTTQNKIAGLASDGSFLYVLDGLGLRKVIHLLYIFLKKGNLTIF